ncbi:hypothetical protein J5U23_02909 [Saccharolobus shibatae B12]|uniref:Uncharacterized protein n=1 Tax=Saccharolobus shibatae (strain ATCC 51178 / DSM 5389 / JCM 8931 / NBRC 15437 / B12) TaxID=523848 RepID=A0A8F5BKM7_SACSH|nr:hypothetical protein [Saccharolobus shibatae]QXJ27127.1 hypothetical protein J5U23_p2909 [Saccharolobus shibatae B12]QXJ30020.1 hypothetical protein J5U23_02909 [Saccharolobus shibatae B12]
MSWIEKFSEIMKQNNITVNVKLPVVETYTKISVPLFVVVPRFDGKYDVQCIGDGKLVVSEKELTDENKAKKLVEECLKFVKNNI